MLNLVPDTSILDTKASINIANGKTFGKPFVKTFVNTLKFSKSTKSIVKSACRINHNAQIVKPNGFFSVREKSFNKDQSGLALITVLLIFSMVTMLAAAMIARQETDIQRTTSVLAIEQAHQLALGAESGAISILRFDQEQFGNKDYAGDASQPNHDPWAYPIPLNFGPVNMTIQIYDLNGRINLNWLAPNHPSRDRARQWLDALYRNLTANPGGFGGAGSNSNSFQEVPYVDFSLIGQFVNPNASFDDLYLSKDVPYVASKQAMTDISELGLVESFDLAPDAVRLLAPYVTAIDDGNFKMNINTIPVELLNAMSESASTNISQSLVEKRAKAGQSDPNNLGFASLDEFWGDSEFEPVTKPPKKEDGNRNSGSERGNGSDSGNGSTNGESTQPALWDKADFSVESNYFEVFAEIDLAGRIETVTSIIRRDQNDYKVISRKFGQRQPNLSPQEIGRRNQTLIGREAAEVK